MNLQDQITEDMKAAMKAKDKIKLQALRLLLARIKDQQIAKREKLTDNDVLKVLTTSAKRYKEAIELYEKSDREDLLENEKRELETISQYLPDQLSETEIENVVKQIISETGVTSIQDLGRVMGAAMERLKGKADGKVVQRIVRQKLS